MNTRWIAAGIVLATLVALGAQASIVARTGFLAGDFRAFYCAARVASEGANPYRAQPLGTCERQVDPTPFFRKNPGVTIPAPLPGYAIAALIPFARLPFAFAAGLWIALLSIAWIACIAALARLASVSWEVALAAMGLSLGVLSLPFGEVVPLCVACICIAAYCVRTGRDRLAALFAAGAMIEPHLGLPVCVALAVWRPATRWVLAAAFAALGGIALFALGIPTNVEYFSSVLPAHALSELTRDTQYSLSALLAAGGVAPNVAVRFGGIWYVAMLALGTLAAGRLARSSSNNAFLVCVPPAFAVFGGSFIHITQIAAAVPAALLFATYAKGALRTAAVIALLLLVVPWGWVVSPALIVAPVVPVAYLAWRFWKGETAYVLLAAIGAALMVFGLQHLYTLQSLHFGIAGAPPPIDPQLAEASWSVYSRGGSGGSLAAWAVRVPTWTGLAALLLMMLREARLVRVRREAIPAVALAVFCTLLPIAGQFSGDRAGGWLAVDFRAYYCAALAEREHFDPYSVQPLAACERQTPAPYYHAPRNVAVPAPYPPYALAALMPLTLLPFDAAVTLWWLAIALSVLIAAYALARLCALPLLTGWAAIALALALPTFSTGNMLPLGLAAVIVAAACARRGKSGYAVAALTLAMIEPQIALPAVIGFFIVMPRARLMLAGAMLALAAISFAAGGFAQNVAYVTSVLPAHALSEVSRDNQYSLATVAASLGVPDATAALAGSISYVAMTAVGAILGVRFASRYRDAAFAVLIPPAFSLLGGSFVHTGEIAAAIPAALLLFTRAAEHRAWLAAALVLLAVPWMFATSVALFLAPFFPVAYLVYVLVKRERSVALMAALVAFAAIAGLFTLSIAFPGHPTGHAHLYPPIDPRLAEASWRAFVLANSTNNPVMWLLRLPTWCGLAVFALGAVALYRDQNVRVAVRGASRAGVAS